MPQFAPSASPRRMWAPFFDFPCEQPSGLGLLGGSSSSTSPASGAPPAVAGKPANKVEESAGALSAAPKPKSAAGGGPPLRPGAISVGTRAEGLQVRGLRISGGAGRCLTSVAVVQDRAYWEVHVVDVTGGHGARLLVGTCNAAAPGGDVLLQDLGATPGSYGVLFGSLGQATLNAGDVISVSYDQAVFPVAINVWHNGSPVPAPPARGLKGEQWPALFVSDLTVDWALDESHWKNKGTCPNGFSALMASRGLIGD